MKISSGDHECEQTMMMMTIWIMNDRLKGKVGQTLDFCQRPSGDFKWPAHTIRWMVMMMMMNKWKHKHTKKILDVN